MAQDNPYQSVIVETYKADRTSGLHGPVHVRPVAGQGLATTLRVECSKKLINDYPVGTKFKLRAKLTDREGSGEFIYSSYRDPIVVVKE